MTASVKVVFCQTPVQAQHSDADYIGDCQKSPKGTFRGPIFMW